MQGQEAFERGLDPLLCYHRRGRYAETTRSGLQILSCIFRTSWHQLSVTCRASLVRTNYTYRPGSGGCRGEIGPFARGQAIPAGFLRDVLLTVGA